MTTQRASRIAGGIALVAVLSVVAIVTWSMLHPSAPGPGVPVADGPAMGDMTGYVGRVDANARTVDVAESLLGLHPTMLVVTGDTSIMVRGKQGALADLAKDMPVRAFYEVRNDVKYLTSLQVITGDSTDMVTATTPADARPVVETTPAGSRRAKEAKPARTRPAVEAKRPVETKPPVAAKPASSPAVASTPSTPPAASALASEAASISSSVPAVQAADPDVGDGSAAIDWLLKELRRR